MLLQRSDIASLLGVQVRYILCRLKIAIYKNTPSSRLTPSLMHAFRRNLNLTATMTVSFYTDAVTYTVLVLLVHALPVEVGAAASTEEVGETCVAAAVDGAAELATAWAAEPEAPPVATAAAVLAAEEATTPPVPAAARADEIEVHAGFLERFSSYRQASPAPEKVDGTQENLS